MPNIIYITPDGKRTELLVTEGTSVMQAALANGLPGLNADCGGACQCATCHVYVEQPWTDHLSAIDDTEDAMLDCTGEPRQASSRLSCQLIVSATMDGMVVRLPVVQ
jgi:ferredoxin, 2Fe-2S